MTTENEPVLEFASGEQWREWLATNHDDSSGVWLRIAKKNAETTSVSYAQALDEALCFGWIDAVKRSYDDSSWLQRFTPRKSRSKWSRINRDNAERLVEEGRMREPGHREVDRAKQDGRWQAAYEPQRTATVPEDLRRELDANPTAKEFFDGLDSQNRYAILHRVADAKHAETRARRISRFVAMLAEHRKLH
ncbi:YdeI/OmpD-associated family protein [Actinopolyspora halophila]|uniref:YdeI/OmpD-associated family protein n=1 Tax=Actinopolyspora halophila TaxID=1850 RepID=UPI00039C2289|nr:YdeI/OmpD-associated family protein [Actinopolyspora halophila]